MRILELYGLLEQMEQLLQQGRGREAIPVIERALSVWPNAESWLLRIPVVRIWLRRVRASLLSNLGAAFYEVWKHEGNRDDLLAAIERYKGALELCPRFADAMSNLGAAYDETGDSALAEHWYRQAVTVNPRHADGWSNLGIILHQREDLTGARACYERAVQLNPCQPKAMNNLGRVCYEEGQFHQALRWYKKAIALEVDPRVQEARRNLQQCAALLDPRRSERSSALERFFLIEPAAGLGPAITADKRECGVAGSPLFVGPEELNQLPLRGIVALAARCVRRIQHIYDVRNDRMDRNRYKVAVRAAIGFAEHYTVGGEPGLCAARSHLYVDEATQAMYAGEYLAADVARAAVCVADAAACAASAEAASRDAAERRTQALRALVAAGRGFAIAVHLGGVDALRAANDDFNKLLGLQLGRFPAPGRPTNTEGGQLGNLWPCDSPPRSRWPMLYRCAEGLRVFNSYAWADAHAVRAAVESLQTAGLCMFLDVNDLDQQLIEYLDRIRDDSDTPSYGEPGVYSWHHLRLALEDAIEDSGLVLFWQSRQSRSSKWVQKELEHAERHGLPLFIIRLDDEPAPPRYASIPALSLDGVRGSLRTVVRELQRHSETARTLAEEQATFELLELNRMRIHLEIWRRLDARTNGTAVWNTARINRLLAERFELCTRLDHNPAAESFLIDGEEVTAIKAIVGNLLLPRRIAGSRSEVWPHYCAKCGGMTNYGKVYPQLDQWITENERWDLLGHGGCSCP